MKNTNQISTVKILSDRYDSLEVQKRIFNENEEQDRKDYLNLKYLVYDFFTDDFWSRCNWDFKNRAVNQPTLKTRGKQTFNLLYRILTKHNSCFLDVDDYLRCWGGADDSFHGFFLHSPIWFKDNNNLYFTLYGMVDHEDIEPVPFYIVLKTVRYVDCYDYCVNTDMIGDDIRNLPSTESLKLYVSLY